MELERDFGKLLILITKYKNIKFLKCSPYLNKFICRYIKHKLSRYLRVTQHYEIVQTKYGRVKGRQCKNIYNEFGLYYAFEGIPYAMPPLGELRFRAPQPPEPWHDVLDCFHCKPKPVQINLKTQWCEGSEDCLYLNVYAKKVRSLIFSNIKCNYRKYLLKSKK